MRFFINLRMRISRNIVRVLRGMVYIGREESLRGREMGWNGIYRRGKSVWLGGYYCC